MKNVDPKNLIMIDEIAVYNCMHKIIRDINLFGFKPDLIVGIQRGGLIPAVHLSHYYDVPMQTIEISFRDSSNIVEFQKKIPTNLKTLVIDDINDSGKTFNYLKEKNKEHSQIQFCSVVDNINSSFQTNFCGLEIAKKEEQWVVFPWEQWWCGVM